MLPSVTTPLFMPTTPLPLPSIMSTPKPSLRVRTWILFLIMPSPLSDISPLSTCSTVPPSRRLSPTLRLPPRPWRHFHIIDLFPTLRQNWSLRAKRHGALAGIRATDLFSYFAASWARKLLRDGTISIQTHASSLKRCWRRRRRRINLD